MENDFWLEWRKEIHAEVKDIHSELTDIKVALGKLEVVTKPTLKEQALPASAGGGIGAAIMACLMFIYEYIKSKG